MRYRLFACTIIVLAAWFTGAAAAQPTLVLNNFTAPPLTNAEGSGFLDQLVGAAFRKAGINLELIALPPERGLRNANAGIDDGDLSRIIGLDQLYSNLMRVPEKIWDMEFVALTRTVDIRIDEWNQLNPYLVAHIKGWKIFETDAYQPANLVTVDDITQLLTLLKLDRVDSVLIEKLSGLEAARRLKIEDIRVLEPPLARREMFIYLHKKHEALIPAIAAALREMKADGTYVRLYEEVFGSPKR